MVVPHPEPEWAPGSERLRAERGDWAESRNPRKVAEIGVPLGNGWWQEGKLPECRGAGRGRHGPGTPLPVHCLLEQVSRGQASRLAACCSDVGSIKDAAPRLCVSPGDTHVQPGKDAPSSTPDLLQ